MIHKCDHCDYESNRMYNIRRHVMDKHESHYLNNENQVDTDVSHEKLPSSPTKINVGLNESLKSTKFSPSPHINDVIEGTNTPLESADSKEVSNEKEDVYADQIEHIKEIMSSYDDSDSEDDQISWENKEEEYGMRTSWGWSCAKLKFSWDWGWGWGWGRVWGWGWGWGWGST